ncbi:MAG: hypothetical protein H0U74_08370 [Bradymonadaceae bacterium]|nr:hypothetical protein [Lujinxingiaceae bacterium]
MTARMFADLHCHPTFYAFNRMRNTPAMEESPESFHPWHELPSDIASQEIGGRARNYSQCSFARMARGNVRLVFMSFTPIERGFFEGSASGDDHAFSAELLRLVSGVTLARSARKLLGGKPQEAFREAGRILRNDGPLRQLIQSLFLKYSFKRVRYILSGEYDYWDEFLREYAFLCTRDGDTVRVALETSVETCLVEGCYHLVATPAALEEVIEKNERDMAVLLTIEGGHVFSIGPDQKPVAPALMFERIALLKSLPHPIFFITIAHHFDNGLCGHAHSLVDAAGHIMDQKPRMNEDFERDGDLGVRVVLELLDLDEKLVDQGGRRILIDSKHMSARTRKSFYEEIVKPYNERHGARPAKERKRYPKLPVIFSHAGYSGVATLDEQISDAFRENDHWHRNPYYAWNINLSDEDVRLVHDSEGLVGLCFDRRIAGIAPGEKVPLETWPRIMLNQIFGLVDVIMLDERLKAADRRTIWDRICIGSDYDGMIDPIAIYPTAMSMPRFSDDLRSLLNEYRHTRMIEQIGVDVLVEKIAWRNAYDFSKKHFPAASTGLEDI